MITPSARQASSNPVPGGRARTAAAETAMHPHVYRIALGCWLCFLAVFWATFWTSSNALFQIVIGTVYAAMFFGVPYEMSRIYPGKRTSDKTIWEFMAGPFGARTGTMRGYEALIQVILVPVLLTIGGTVIGVIIHLSRHTH